MILNVWIDDWIYFTPNMMELASHSIFFLTVRYLNSILNFSSQLHEWCLFTFRNCSSCNCCSLCWIWFTCNNENGKSVACMLSKKRKTSHTCKPYEILAAVKTVVSQGTEWNEFTIIFDTNQNNCCLPQELMFHHCLFLQLVFLIEGIKENGKD